VAESVDAAVRLRAFAVLADLRNVYGDSPIPRTVLAKGFEFEGVRVPFLGPQGIFKPALLSDVPLSITTVPRLRIVLARTTTTSPRAVS
jgi:putative restriction endonuclease